jgi:fatty acid desaturase
MGEAYPVDLAALEASGFFDELAELRREVEAKLGEEDIAHLAKIERWGRIATLIGALTAGLGPNPVSALGLGVGRSTRWIIMHHIAHRGYDKVPGIAPEKTSRLFAKGHRRFIDWFDWIVPEAWIYEHNVLHHSHTGEGRDPDLLERNATSLREGPLPMAARYGLLSLLSLSWRPVYYAPSTLRAWMRRHEPTTDKRPEPRDGDQKDLWLRCYLPFGTAQFVLFPLMYLPMGPMASLSALANSVIGDIICNLHTFMVVGPNHSGDDLYRFSKPPTTKSERLLRQIIGSTNYPTGSDWRDFLYLWLNYQIEHHIWPDLPMNRYAELQPKVKALCEKHGVPYVQEPLWIRVKKTFQMAAGATSMKVV